MIGRAAKTALCRRYVETIQHVVRSPHGHAMTTRALTKAEVEAEPFAIWNAYVDLLAMEHYRDLTPQQRADK